MARLFVAVFPPAAVVADLAARLAAAPVRLVAAAKWHVTLAFLGDVPDGRLPAVHAALDAVRHPPVRLRLSGGGRFGRGRTGAVWAGVDGDAAGPAAAVRDALAGAGLPADPRPLRPHLTVAYAGGGPPATLDGYTGPWWTAAAFTLARSRHPEPGGYEHLRSWPLAPVLPAAGPGPPGEAGGDHPRTGPP